MGEIAQSYPDQYEYRADPTWRTKGGEIIKIKDLEDTHLINCINLIWRNRRKLKSAAELQMVQAVSMLHGDMATFYAERDLQALEDTSAEEFVFEETKLKHLWAEARRRGLFSQTAVEERYWYSDSEC